MFLAAFGLSLSEIKSEQDELGYAPLSQTRAELLFEISSQRHERGSTIVTSNLPFEEWTGS